MISERMQIMIEYRDVLREILDLEEQIMGVEPFIDEKAVKEDKKEEDTDPEQKKTTKKITVDKGKIIALRNAGWKYKDIAEDVGCSEATVYSVLKEARG